LEGAPIACSERAVFVAAGNAGTSLVNADVPPNSNFHRTSRGIEAQDSLLPSAVSSNEH
jgi:hypothetical protein